MNVISHGHPSIFCGLFGLIVIMISFRRRTFDYIFVGDVNFYYWSKYLVAPRVDYRFHNFYLKMYSALKSKKLLFKNLRLFVECSRFMQVEKQIIRKAKNNSDIKLLFISMEEYQHCVGKYDYMGDVLSLDIDYKMVHPKREMKWNGKFVWFGGISSHKSIGIDLFIEKVYRKIKSAIPDTVFELYGVGSEKYTNRELGIMGFGFVKKFTYKDHENSLFINPDLVGGGVKLKLHEMYVNNIHCLSTPLGVEGSPFIENWPNIAICEFEKWYTFIISLKR